MFITLSITAKQAFRVSNSCQANKDRLFEKCDRNVIELLQTVYKTQIRDKSRFYGAKVQKHRLRCPSEKYSEK